MAEHRMNSFWYTLVCSISQDKEEELTRAVQKCLGRSVECRLKDGNFEVLLIGKYESDLLGKNWVAYNALYKSS